MAQSITVNPELALRIDDELRYWTTSCYRFGIFEFVIGILLPVLFLIYKAEARSSFGFSSVIWMIFWSALLYSNIRNYMRATKVRQEVRSQFQLPLSK